MAMGDVQMADIAPPEEVRRRIEALVLEFLRGLVSHERPSIKSLSLVRRDASNIRAYGGDDEIVKVGLVHTLQERTLTGLNGKSVLPYVRVWKVLAVVYKLLEDGRMSTQREIYYRLLGENQEYFKKQRDCNAAIQETVSLLRCSRCSLGIYASSKGTVAGRLSIREGETGQWIDCTSRGSAGVSITGNLWHIEKLTFKTDARYIIVVEKDTVFQRLVQDRLFQEIPCILITAKGFPDLATRAFLRSLHLHYPKIPILGLVDMNPAGLSIICTYKFGSGQMGLEGPRYACDVKWLGLRYGDVKYVPDDGLQPLSNRDRVLAQSLMQSAALQMSSSYIDELEAMVDYGKKADIEALHSNGADFLVKFIIQKIVHQDYI